MHHTSCIRHGRIRIAIIISTCLVLLPKTCSSADDILQGGGNSSGNGTAAHVTSPRSTDPATTSRSSSSDSSQKSPNLIVIMADDLGFGDVGFNGCRDIPTPHLDSIALRNGVRFSRAYVSSSMCGPSRAGFITGRYQDRFGFTSHPPANPARVGGVPSTERTMAEALRDGGRYGSAAMIGKWHLGAHATSYPLDRGFDYFYGFLAGKSGYRRGKLLENRQTVSVDKYLTDDFTDRAVEYIEERLRKDDKERVGGEEEEEDEKPKPFFLFLSYNAPHLPLDAPDRYQDDIPDGTASTKKKRKYRRKRRRATYAGMVRAMDDGVGRVLDAVEAGGATDDTIVVFLSDNGGPKNNGSSNGPFRGHKWTMYDGGLRVPFAMQWPGTIPGGVSYDEPISSLDVMATIVGINGIAQDPNLPLDGVNLMPYLTGERSGRPHDYLFWKLLRDSPRKATASKKSMAVQRGRHKLLTRSSDVDDPQETWRYEMYDLIADEEERNDMMKSTGLFQWQTKRIKRDLHAAWDEWNAETRTCWWK